MTPELNRLIAEDLDRRDADRTRRLALLFDLYDYIYAAPPAEDDVNVFVALVNRLHDERIKAA